MHLLWLPVVAILLLLFPGLALFRGGQSVYAPGGSDPEQLLRVRLARGEITREEYERTLPLLK